MMTLSATPDVIYKRSEAGYQLEFAAPGENKDNINIEVHNGALTFEAKPMFDVGERQRISRPLFPTEYVHRLQLGEDIDTEKISASGKNGIVTVSLPKNPEAQPRRLHDAG